MVREGGRTKEGRVKEEGGVRGREGEREDERGKGEGRGRGEREGGRTGGRKREG